MPRIALFLIVTFLTTTFCLEASDINYKIFSDFRIDGFYQFEGIAQIDNDKAGHIACYRFGYRNDELVEIAYVKGSISYSFSSDGVSKIEIVYPDQSHMECTFFNSDGLRTTYDGIDRWVIEFGELFINKYNYDADRNLTKDNNGIFQYSYRLYENGSIKLRHGKDKLYKTILDDCKVYERLYYYDENGNQIKKIFRNKDGSFFYNADAGYAIKYSIYDSNKNEIEVRYYDENERPVTNPNCNCFSIKKKYEDNMQLIEKRFYDTNYNLTFDKDYKASVIKYVISNSLQTTAHIYLDTAERPTPRKGFGFARVEVDYDSRGREIEKRYYDQFHSLLNIEHGYAIEVFEWDDLNRVLTEYKKDAHGRVVTFGENKNFSKLVLIYDQKGLVEKEYYLNENNNLIPRSENDYYFIINTYNERGLIRSYTYYDKHGIPQIVDEGYAHVEIVYDSNGFLYEQRYFDNNYQPVNVEDGYALVVEEHNKVGEMLSQSFYDLNNEPVNIRGDGYHKYKFSSIGDEGDLYKELEYFDKSGNLTISSKNSYAKRIYKYDSRGNLLEERYEDETGNLRVPFNNTYAKVFHEYDDDFNLSKTSYYDDQEILANNSSDSTGYAKIIYSYDENNHWYKQKIYDHNGKKINEYNRPKEGNLLGIHLFRLYNLQVYFVIAICIIVVLYFFLRKKTFFGKNKTPINYFFLIGIIHTLLGLSILKGDHQLNGQFLVFFIFNVNIVLILFLSFAHRRIVATLIIIIFLAGLAVHHVNTLYSYIQFRNWWYVFFVPQLSIAIFLMLNVKLARWKKALFPIITMVCLSAIILYLKNPYGGTRWKNWEEGNVTNNDFLGSPDIGTNYAATIFSTVFLDYDCEEAEFKFQSSARMNRFSSWKNESLSPYLLNHEQRHFDIARIHADILKDRLNAIKDPCDLSEGELNAKVDEIKADIAQQLKATQKNYDHETEHSLLENFQTSWNNYIDDELNDSLN